MFGIGRAYDFCALGQVSYHNKYHVIPVDKGSLKASCGRVEGANCEGVLLESLPNQGKDYMKNSPLRNAFDRWGQVPGLAVITGLSRWTFSLVELGVGILGAPAGLISWMACVFLGIKDSWAESCFFGSLELYGHGCDDFWTGLKEVASFGFYPSIEATLAGLRERIWSHPEASE